MARHFAMHCGQPEFARLGFESWTKILAAKTVFSESAFNFQSRVHLWHVFFRFLFVHKEGMIWLLRFVAMSLPFWPCGAPFF